MPKDKDKDDRDRKSWREIDKLRDSSRHLERPAEDPKEKRRQNSAAYQNYKEDLGKVFSGGEVPGYLKSLLPAAASGMEEGQLKLIGAIQRADGEEELAKAVKDYRAKFAEFPDDFDLLLKLLDCPDEETQLIALKQLDRLELEQPVPHKRQFALKLDALAMAAEDDLLKELAEELVERLK